MVILALSVPLTLFNMCLLLNPHYRPFGRPSLWAPAAGLCLSAPRPCGRVGWQLFPLHLHSSVVVARAFVAPFRCGVVEVSPMSSANNSHSLSAALSPVCQTCRAHRHGLQRSPGHSRFGGFLSSLFWHTCPGTVALGHRRSCGRHVSPAIPLPQRAHTDALLNQLVGPSHENFLARCWERSTA